MKYWAVQVKCVGKVRFKGHIADDTVIRNVRILRHMLGTGFDVRLIVQPPDTHGVDNRDVVGIDLGVKAPCSLPSGVHYAPIRISDRKRKRTQCAVARAKRQTRSHAKKKLALSGESRRMAVKARNAVHRLTSHLVKNHSANLATEDSQIHSMTVRGGSCKKGLNRAMRKQSLALMAAQLAYKAECA